MQTASHLFPRKFGRNLKKSGASSTIRFAIDALERVAAARKSLFVPIRLVCEVDELCRRVVDPTRRERLKEISVENARRKSAEDAVLKPKHSNLRTIDVTSKSPSETADAIIREVDSIKAEAGLLH